VVEGFDHRFVMNMNVGNRQNNIVSYTSIYYNKDISHRGGGINGKGIQLLNVKLGRRILAFDKKMKRKMVRKIIYDSITRTKFRVERIK